MIALLFCFMKLCIQSNNHLANENEKANNNHKNITTELGVNRSLNGRKRKIYKNVRSKPSIMNGTIKNREKIDSLNSELEFSNNLTNSTTKLQIPENYSTIIIPTSVKTKEFGNYTMFKWPFDKDCDQLGSIQFEIILEIFENQLISLIQKIVSNDPKALAKKKLIEELIRSINSTRQKLASLKSSSSTKKR